MASGPSVLPSSASNSQSHGAPSQELKKEDWRKVKELEEARKAGTAPALTDEEGRDINPHIPQYIATVPWYVGLDQPTLKHQRVQEEKVKHYNKIGDWYKKGVNEVVATKFRKGACANCGSMTHKKKDCVERPRKVGAKFTGEKIAPDEHIQSTFSFDYDGKRDRWNGYDPQEHERVIQEFAKVEEAKKHLKVKKLYDEMLSGQLKVEEQKDEGSGNEDDEDKYADDFDMPGTNFDSKRRITVRNLRIREDTAKYLHNLNPNSAYYDPKTRSMRTNPFKDSGDSESQLKFAGENFIRSTGDTLKIASAQMFAWDAERKGTDVHLQADPTKLELLQRQFVTKKDDFKNKQKSSILKKYGGEEHLETPPRELLLAQTEDYVEYSKHGTLVKGQEKAAVKSRYLEDVFINNHPCVWGSFWRDGHWGYGCCSSTVKMSYCVGAAGRQAQTDGEPLALTGPDHDEEEVEEIEKSLVEQHKEKLEREQRKREKRKRKKQKRKNKNKKKSKKESSSSDSSSSEENEDEETIRQEKIKKAVKEQAAQDREAERLLKMDERKRPYNSLVTMEDFRQPTEEEMEAFRMKRKRTEDPMANFLS